MKKSVFIVVKTVLRSIVGYAADRISWIPVKCFADKADAEEFAEAQNEQSMLKHDEEIEACTNPNVVPFTNYEVMEIPAI